MLTGLIKGRYSLENIQIGEVRHIGDGVRVQKEDVIEPETTCKMRVESTNPMCLHRQCFKRRQIGKCMEGKARDIIEFQIPDLICYLCDLRSD